MISARKRFRLTHSILAFLDNPYPHKWLTVPAGEIVEVTSDTKSGGGDQGVRVRWNGRKLVMFAIDLLADGIELHDEVGASRVGKPEA